METNRLGEYTGIITIGETRCEQFHIVVNRDREAAIHPRTPLGSADAEVSGPDAESKGLHWKIDGRADHALPGTTYNITLRWSFDWEMGERKSISWQRSKNDAVALEYSHEYDVVATWTSWQFYRLTPSRTEPGVYSMTARIGTSGTEEFQIVRDRDWSQVIYPAKNHPIKSNIPIKGPDENGKGKSWLVRGPPGFKLDVELRMTAGSIEMSLNIEKKGKKTWKSNHGRPDNWHDYYISGSWNNWGLSAMVPDFVGGSVFRARDVIVGPDGVEEFRIVVDKDEKQTLYPVDGILHGPDAQGNGFAWRIEDSPGVEFEILLDNSSGVPVVTWSKA